MQSFFSSSPKKEKWGKKKNTKNTKNYNRSYSCISCIYMFSLFGTLDYVAKIYEGWDFWLLRQKRDSGGRKVDQESKTQKIWKDTSLNHKVLDFLRRLSYLIKSWSFNRYILSITRILRENILNHCSVSYFLHTKWLNINDTLKYMKKWEN